MFIIMALDNVFTVNKLILIINWICLYTADIILLPL